MSNEQIGMIILYSFSAGTFISIIAALYCKHNRGWSNEGVLAAIVFWPLLWGIGIVAAAIFGLGWTICAGMWLIDFPMRYSAILFRKPVKDGLTFKEHYREFFGDAQEEREREHRERFFKGMREQHSVLKRAEQIRQETVQSAVVNTNKKAGLH